MLQLLVLLFALQAVVGQNTGWTKSLAKQQRGATTYWPVLSPTESNPWVAGQKNLLSWECAFMTGIESFDVRLHNWDHSVMEGFIPVALRVPMQRMKKGYRNLGGEIEVDLGADIPTGEGFIISFIESVHGQVYAHSDPFPIVAQAPANYSSITYTPTVTATLDMGPNPTLTWPITMDGKPVPTGYQPSK